MTTGNLTDPCFFRNDSSCDDLTSHSVRLRVAQPEQATNLEVMHVEDILERWPGSQRCLSCLLFWGDFFHDLRHRTLIDDTEAKAGKVRPWCMKH